MYLAYKSAIEINIELKGHGGIFQYQLLVLGIMFMVENDQIDHGNRVIAVYHELCWKQSIHKAPGNFLIDGWF